MTKFRVPVYIKIDGAVEVEAEDELEAEEIACANVRGNLDHINTNDSEKILDFEFDCWGESYLRDDESIEEVEEEDD